MPNTPALVGAGVSAIAAGRAAGDDDLAWAERDPRRGGRGGHRAREAARRGHRALGSGPAYVFLVVEAMIDAGVLAGLPRDVAETLAIGTVAGAARLLDRDRRHPGRAPGRGHLARRHHRGRPARARAGRACGPPSSTPSRRGDGERSRELGCRVTTPC